jgi:hypothetical protein
MIAAIVAATIAARNQRGGVRYPTKRKISKWEWAFYAFTLIAMLTIIVLAALGF